MLLGLEQSLAYTKMISTYFSNDNHLSLPTIWFLLFVLL